MEKTFAEEKYYRMWDLQQKVARWLVDLSRQELLELNEMYDAPSGVVKDWIEDHGGERKYYQLIKWLSKYVDCVGV